MTKLELKQIKKALKEGDLKIIAEITGLHYQTVQNVFRGDSPPRTRRDVVIQARLRLDANRKESEKAIKLIDKYV
jgi:FAD synthase